MKPTSAIIVAGGQSTRLGQDKRRLRLWGEEWPCLLERTVAIAQTLCDEVIVVLNDPADWRNLPARMVYDIWPDVGPLGGLASGLRAAHYEWSLVLSADLPLLNIALLRAMLAQPRQGDAIVPHHVAADRDEALANDGFEPLHALYRYTCVPAIEARLAAGQRQVASFFPFVQLHIFGPDQIASYDPAGNSFINLNTPEQLASVQRMIKQMRD